MSCEKFLKPVGIMVELLSSVCTGATTHGLKKIIRRSSNLALGGRLVTAIPAGIVATALTVGALPVALLLDRIAKPILKSTNALRDKNNENYTRKHKVVSWALMPLKLIATVPAAALVSVIMAVISPFLLISLVGGIAVGAKYCRNF